MVKNIVLFGAPGAGKGTLAGIIKKICSIVHISTGDLLRENITKGTEIGKQAKGFMDKGTLVPDEIVIKMVQTRITEKDAKQNGFMLDGFPRTLDQAKALDKVTTLNLVVVIDIEKDTLKKRILGRYNCPKCGYIYNIFNNEMKPKKEGICDKDGTPLTHRTDDNEEIFEKRWNTYLSQSQDVITYYSSKKDLVLHMDGINFIKIPELELKKKLKL